MQGVPPSDPVAATSAAAIEQHELERSSSAPGAARRHVDEHRNALGEDAWRRARLLVSELVTNALRHGSGAIVLELTPLPSGGLRVCVHDEGGGRPEPREPDEDGGYGLHLVRDLSDRSGHGEGINAMWFEIDHRDER